MPRFPELAAGLPYGWRLLYALQIEGLQWVLTERDVGASDPTGYGQEHGVLVIDDSAAIGSRVDRQRGIGSGYDLAVKVLRSDTTEAWFARPSKWTRLTEDLAYDATTVKVESTSGWTATDFIYLGPECLGQPGVITATQFQAVTRGSPNGTWKGYDVPINSELSTWVTNKPLFWRGRTVKLWAVAVDPYGVTHGTDLLDGAALVWRGTIASQIGYDVDGWTFRCRSVERVLEQPIGVTVSGRGKLGFTADPIVEVDPLWTFGGSVWHMDWATLAETKQKLSMQPFAAYDAGDTLHLSECRAVIKEAWDACVGATVSTGVDHVGPAAWSVEDQSLPEGGVMRRHRLVCQLADEATVNLFWEIGKMPMHRTLGLTVDIAGEQIPTNTAPDYNWRPVPFVQEHVASITSLAVELDEGAPADVPTSGWVIIEIDGRDLRYAYYDTVVEGGTLTLLIEPGSGPGLDAFDPSAADGALGDVAVRLAYRDSGAYADLMRRMILSSGRGDNDATYDTLPRSQAYDVAGVDTDSFDLLMDGVWPGLDGVVVVDDMTSFVEVYGTMLALAQLALVPREDDDGADIDLALVSLSVLDTPTATATITDADLVTDGRNLSPVRSVEQVIAPNSIEVKVVYGGEERLVYVNDVVAQRAEGLERWKFTIHGVERSTIQAAVVQWARRFFATKHVGQVYELDVLPSCAAQTGDLIDLDLTHYQVWDRSTGAKGYSGYARVLGRRVDHRSAIQTLTVLTQGAYATGLLSPSLPVDSWTGTAAAPTTITLDDDGEAYELLRAYRAAGNFDLKAYVPSYDATAYAYTIDGVSLGGGQTVLSVYAVTGSFSLTTDYRLTLPATGSCTAPQLLHMHTDSTYSWR